MKTTYLFGEVRGIMKAVRAAKDGVLLASTVEELAKRYKRSPSVIRRWASWIRTKGRNLRGKNFMLLGSVSVTFDPLPEGIPALGLCCPFCHRSMAEISRTLNVSQKWLLEQHLTYHARDAYDRVLKAANQVADGAVSGPALTLKNALDHADRVMAITQDAIQEAKKEGV